MKAFVDDESGAARICGSTDRARRRLAAVLGAMILAAGVASLSSAPGASADQTRAGPPRGLSAYGRRVWNLEALLRDVFGKRIVYLQYGNPWGVRPNNFSSKYRSNVSSRQYVYTFASARSSRFEIMTSKRRLPTSVGGTGGVVPLTISGRYIYCGGGRWLYQYYGAGPANFQIGCAAVG